MKFLMAKISIKILVLTKCDNDIYDMSAEKLKTL